MKQISKFTEFDALLIAQISAGRNTLAMLDCRASGLLEAAKPFQIQDRHGYLTEPFRIIDRRLQALRKDGKIRFTGKVWGLQA